MLTEILTKLKYLGLTEKDARVYVALLSFDTATVQQISIKSNVKRTTVYNCLTTLIQKGLASFVYVGMKNLYKAKNPDFLKKLVDGQRDDVLKIIPELNNYLTNVSSENLLEIYKGAEGIKTAILEILKNASENSDYMIISDREKLINLDKNFPFTFIKNYKANLNFKLLLTENNKDSKIYLPKNRTTKKYLPKGFKINSNITIQGNTVLIQKMNAPYFAIKINSKEVADTYNQLFELIWQKSK